MPPERGHMDRPTDAATGPCAWEIVRRSPDRQQVGLFLRPNWAGSLCNRGWTRSASNKCGVVFWSGGYHARKRGLPPPSIHGCRPTSMLTPPGAFRFLRPACHHTCATCLLKCCF